QGQNRYTTEVVADVMQLLGRAPGREDNAPQATAPAAAQPAAARPAAAQPAQPAAASPSAAPGTADDLPF
ncbi:MAG: single-stranded DNA-binding protein, partial [Crocinitomicaceae bacterium]|nr:single-stranded DNA-binding protein [Crocinitomicaceae bacterium]